MYFISIHKREATHKVLDLMIKVQAGRPLRSSQRALRGAAVLQ
jgi:hypothetical protein